MACAPNKPAGVRRAVEEPKAFRRLVYRKREMGRNEHPVVSVLLKTALLRALDPFTILLTCKALSVALPSCLYRHHFSHTLPLFYFCDRVRLSPLVLRPQFGPLYQPSVIGKRMEQW
jgi:hypothetical protein